MPRLAGRDRRPGSRLRGGLPIDPAPGAAYGGVDGHFDRQEAPPCRHPIPRSTWHSSTSTPGIGNAPRRACAAGRPPRGARAMRSRSAPPSRGWPGRITSRRTPWRAIWRPDTPGCRTCATCSPATRPATSPPTPMPRRRSPRRATGPAALTPTPSRRCPPDTAMAATRIQTQPARTPGRCRPIRARTPLARPRGPGRQGAGARPAVRRCHRIGRPVRDRATLRHRLHRRRRVQPPHLDDAGAG